jgi:hypothetical protein
MTLGTTQVVLEEASPPMSKKKFVIYGIAILVVCLTGVVLLWKFYLCPGNLGYFSWFRCKCVTDSSPLSRRCTCDENFNERGKECQACGDVGQPCCEKDLLPCRYSPNMQDVYKCFNGSCSKIL